MLRYLLENNVPTWAHNLRINRRRTVVDVQRSISVKAQYAEDYDPGIGRSQSDPGLGKAGTSEGSGTTVSHFLSYFVIKEDVPIPGELEALTTFFL
ncbi:uncharacterized protein UHOD_12040 [Ustilago sp. UG-2017b]|nr:uncharacterized protein UHOD_12040 [Ustilago sp. UG-2017b]